VTYVSPVLHASRPCLNPPRRQSSTAMPSLCASPHLVFVYNSIGWRLQSIRCLPCTNNVYSYASSPNSNAILKLSPSVVPKRYVSRLFSTGRIPDATSDRHITPPLPNPLRPTLHPRPYRRIHQQSHRRKYKDKHHRLIFRRVTLETCRDDVFVLCVLAYG
jgi:hypothetical protein